MSLREEHKQRTRTQLADAALQLFRKRGFEATTIDDIASRAGVSRRTFFRYFATKEDVVFAGNAERLQLFQDVLSRELVVHDGFESVRRACLEVARHYMVIRAEVVEQYRLVVRSPSLVAREMELDRGWEDAIALTLAYAEPDERRARVLAGAVFGAIRATLRDWFASSGKADLVAMGERTFEWLGMLRFSSAATTKAAKPTRAKTRSRS